MLPLLYLDGRSWKTFNHTVRDIIAKSSYFRFTAGASTSGSAQEGSVSQSCVQMRHELTRDLMIPSSILRQMVCLYVCVSHLSSTFVNVKATCDTQLEVFA